MTTQNGSVRPETSDVDAILAKRQEYLAALRDRPLAKRDISEELGTPRSTVDRSVRELEGAGLVEREDGAYRLTTCGELALREREAYLRNVDAICQSCGAIGPLDGGSGLDTAMLVGADVYESEPHAPDRPLHPLITGIREADRIRGLTPVALAAYVDVFHDCIVNHGLQFEVVCPPEVLAYLESTYHERVHEAHRTGRLTFYRTDRELPFGLCLMDTGNDGSVATIVYSDTGVHSTLINDTDDAISWAESFYERFKRRAAPVESPTAATPPADQ